MQFTGIHAATLKMLKEMFNKYNSFPPISPQFEFEVNALLIMDVFLTDRLYRFIFVLFVNFL